MRMHYSQNPSVHYLQISDDEIVVKGSHLEGFSLIVGDDSNRGLAALVVDAVRDGATATEVHRHASAQVEVTLAEIESFLTELSETGVLLRHGEHRNRIAEWVSFLRYGRIEPDSQVHPLVIAGPAIAKRAADALTELGFDARHVELADLTELSDFTMPDVTSNVADRLAADPGSGLVEQGDLPDDDRPRLAVFVEGAPLLALYELNEKAIRAGAPVFYNQVAGVDYAIGPYVIPGATACFWEFERQRARSLFSYSEYAVLAATKSTATTPGISVNAAIAAATPYLLELALLGRSMLAGQLIRGRATTSETSRHSVMRLPRCPTCLAERPMLRNLLF